MKPSTTPSAGDSPAMTRAEKMYIVKALFVRFLFCLHNFVAIWRTITVIGDPLYWVYCSTYLLVIVETAYCLKIRKGKEHSWMSLCTFVFTLINVPCIWRLELDKINGTPNRNISTAEALNILYGDGLSVNLTNETWVFTIEQTFLLLIIFARWILPKGRLTRDKLSQLLFVFLSKASDVTDFFQLFDENQVKRDDVVVYSILSIWTLSVLQFSLVLTETKDKETGSDDIQNENRIMNTCLETDVWSNIVSLVMEEIPFFVVRMYAIATYNLVTYSIIFFAAKNMLMITMLAYRLFSVFNDVRETRVLKNNRISPSMNRLSGTFRKMEDPSNKVVKRDAFVDTGSDTNPGSDVKYLSKNRPKRRPETFVVGIDDYINS
ncbi:transmembrane protein 26-like [Ylistrum balloti]|uniref:transmembrane protein 26-like n=1 Tax=Ylistrum balloti TaxID=509963 RepID=UPI002905D0FF|nr:transmembrane protein 26-like [Ylistrum balloti]